MLEGMDLQFRVIKPDVEELWPEGLKGAEIPLFLSKLKAASFETSVFRENTILIAADTVVVLNDAVIGKPADEAEAADMLSRLSGNMHEVYTAVTLRNRTSEFSFFDQTRVFFKELSRKEIDAYVEKYRPLDKAGAYGVQEWIGHVAIARIEGSYNNVMGLPTAMLYDALKNFLS